MKHLKPFNYPKDVFIEYKLEYIDSGGPDTLIHDRLTSILKFVKKHNLRKYTIFGFKNGEWQVMIKY